MLDPELLEVSPGSEHEVLQGWISELSSDDETRDALEKAFSYRGDVTITRKDGSNLECYVFDRRTGVSLAESVVRVIPVDTTTKLSIPYSDIARLQFTGKDTAAGKSWEAWVRKYWEKRAAGEQGIGIDPESLD
jgi:hypothetical protein